MENEELVLEITQEDIDSSTNNYLDTCNCPAAIAAKRLFNNQDARAGGNYVKSSPGMVLYYFKNPDLWNSLVFNSALTERLKEPIRIPLTLNREY